MSLPWVSNKTVLGRTTASTWWDQGHKCRPQNNVSGTNWVKGQLNGTEPSHQWSLGCSPSSWHWTRCLQAVMFSLSLWNGDNNIYWADPPHKDPTKSQMEAAFLKRKACPQERSYHHLVTKTKKSYQTDLFLLTWKILACVERSTLNPSKPRSQLSQFHMVRWLLTIQST